MAPTTAELRKAADQARHKIERKGTLIRLANKRIEKWERKRKAKKKGAPGHARALRKLVLWRRRKHDAIYLRTHWRTILADALRVLASRTPARLKLLATALDDVGAVEGGKAHRDAAAFIGAEVGWPWCSTILGWWLHKALGFARSELPATAPYSGSWAAWGGGKRVAIHKRENGDILVFDWGDGGMTDHVATQRNPHEHVGGNQSDAVNIRPTPEGAIVFVVRPRQRSK
ncbi:MAG: hypothetical protein IT377_01125 [Polyangiaceae bacterium]|nr:hypothetical protein [Polyangiaceae bacterium]